MTTGSTPEEQRYPGRRPEHEIERDPADADRPKPEHRGEEPDGPHQAGQLQVLGVRGRNHHQGQQVVDHDQREDERLQAVRQPADQPQQSERQAVSADIAIPQPRAVESPRLNAR